MRLFNKLGKGLSLTIYIGLVLFVSCAGKAATYLECTSRDIKTCSKEITKGEAIIKLAKEPNTNIIKIDFVKLNLDKGTLKNDAR